MIKNIKKKVVDWKDDVVFMWKSNFQEIKKEYQKTTHWKDLDDEGKDLLLDLFGNQNDFIFSWLLMLSVFLIPTFSKIIMWPVRFFFILTFVVRLRKLILVSTRFKQRYLV